MTSSRAVLHNVQLQIQPRRLTRPVFTSNSVQLPTGREALPVESRTPDSREDRPAKPQSQTMAPHESPRMGSPQKHGADYESGYHDGLAQAGREAQEKMEALAQQLAKKHIEDAYAQAEQQAQKRIQQRQTQLQLQFERVKALSHELPAQFTRYLQDAEDDMLALVYDVVCRILGDEAAGLPGLRTQLQLTLKAWNGRSSLSVHLHPEDIELLQSDERCLQMLRNAGFNSEKSSLRWVADSNIKLGGCMLRSSEGELDARLEVQMEVLKSSLLKTRTMRKSAGVQIDLKARDAQP